MYIYVIINTINNKIYVGKTINNPVLRVNAHLSGNSNNFLREDVIKYGKDSFHKEYFKFDVDEKTLYEIETHYITNVFNSLVPKGYNIIDKANVDNLKYHIHKAWAYEKEICEHYTTEKQSMLTIAYKYGCSDGLVWQMLMKNGIKARNKQGKSPLWLKQTEICSMFVNQGKTLKEIADALGGSTPLIRNILSENGVVTPTSKHNHAAWRKQHSICELYTASCLSIKQLSKQFECSLGTISRILNENGIIIRGAGRPRKSV